MDASYAHLILHHGPT